MSEGGLHVHAPHEEVIQHPGHFPQHSLNQWVAIFTALIAALGSLLTYQGTLLMEDILVQKDDAVLQKAHATDLWGYYQAVSTKQHLMELSRPQAAPRQLPEIDAEIAKYKQQKAALEQRAEAMDTASRQADIRSERMGGPHAGLLQALIALQVAVSLASITALTHKRWLFACAIFSGAAGVAVWAHALLSVGTL